MVGEASISLATACFGTSVNGNSGHDENDVLFIAFPGSDAVPGADGADWAAQNYDDFEASITDLGNTLIQRLGGGGGGGDPEDPDEPEDPPADDCEWAGHCEGTLDNLATDAPPRVVWSLVFPLLTVCLSRRDVLYGR